MALGACTGAPGPRSQSPPTSRPSATGPSRPEEQLLAAVGDIGELTWRCRGERTKLVRFTSDPLTATNEVTVTGLRYRIHRLLNPGRHVTIAVTRARSPRLEIVQATEGRTKIVHVRLWFGVGRRCLSYIPPRSSMRATTHTH
jgi:hypothetical protein